MVNTYAEILMSFKKYFCMIKNIWCGHRAVAELPPDGGLHQVVRLQVHCSRGLVQYQHLKTDIILLVKQKEVHEEEGL